MNNIDQINEQELESLAIKINDLLESKGVSCQDDGVADIFILDNGNIRLFRIPKLSKLEHVKKVRAMQDAIDELEKLTDI